MGRGSACILVVMAGGCTLAALMRLMSYGVKVSRACFSHSKTTKWSGVNALRMLIIRHIRKDARLVMISKSLQREELWCAVTALWARCTQHAIWVRRLLLAEMLKTLTLRLLTDYNTCILIGNQARKLGVAHRLWLPVCGTM